jgi:hypothetical protein
MYKNYQKIMKRNTFLIFKLFNFYILAAAMLLTSCADMLETESELVEYEKDNTLNHPTDSVYSVMGIINKMQIIADRSVLLGEVRGDLVSPTEAASADLKRLANFDLAQDNKYNQVSDYYAVINNCNYYLAYIDTTLQRRGRVLFEREYAAVKAFRAWTYLELVKAYGKVPLVTTPMMTEREANYALSITPSNIKEVCQYFIDDLKPLAEVKVPDFGTIGDYKSVDFFLPIKALLGDLYLWSEQYKDAAFWYHEYLNDQDKVIMMEKDNRVFWNSISEYLTPRNTYQVDKTEEILSYIPMETQIFDGNVSDLINVFCSTKNNNYYAQLIPSEAIYQLSNSQYYCTEHKTDVAVDTVYAPRTGFLSNIYLGDLRLSAVFSEKSVEGQDSYSEYSSLRHENKKFMNNSSLTTKDRIITYRSPMVYLRYAEALNRANYPSSAFAVLKYGLCAEHLLNYVDPREQAAAGDLIVFRSDFNHDNTVGIHSRGSGDSHCNDKYYSMPMPEEAQATYEDTVKCQIPLVEDLIINEMALEGSFEGNRFYDLLRVASRPDRDASYLANRIALRNGSDNATLKALLMNKDNWFLPLPR